MPTDLDKQEQKEAFKEAISEMVSSQVQKLGVLTLKSLAILAIGGLIYLAMFKLGFKPS